MIQPATLEGFRAVVHAVSELFEFAVILWLVVQVNELKRKKP